MKFTKYGGINKFLLFLLRIQKPILRLLAWTSFFTLIFVMIDGKEIRNFYITIPVLFMFVFLMLSLIHLIIDGVLYRNIISVIDYMYGITDVILNGHVPEELKEAIGFKITVIRNKFIPKVMGLKMFYSYWYDEEDMERGLIEAIEETVNEYEEMWRNQGISEEFIKKFHEIHKRNIDLFIQKMKRMIYSTDFTIEDKKKFFYASLKKLMEETLMDLNYLVVNHKINIRDSEKEGENNDNLN